LVGFVLCKNLVGFVLCKNLVGFVLCKNLVGFVLCKNLVGFVLVKLSCWRLSSSFGLQAKDLALGLLLQILSKGVSDFGRHFLQSLQNQISFIKGKFKRKFLHNKVFVLRDWRQRA
jgi:hypothetical protein